MTESLGSGTYEVLRTRLRDAATDLRSRFEALNTARANVFGNIETRLLGTAHVSTDHNCVPRSLLALGDSLLLAYNVNFGLKTEIAVSDVFSYYRLDEEAAHTRELHEIFDERFRRDFKELYRYYKNAAFSRFRVNGPFAYFIFQVGKSESDIKAFKFSIEEDSLKYIDNRSDQEVRLPEQYGFRWKRTTRDQHRSGVHPHVSIEDIVFVECVGGDLTIKVEDNTEDGSGLYAEPVDNPDQTLDDAEVFYCVLGNLVLLKMRPYQESDFRHFVFSIKQQSVVRLDAISETCVLLPDDHGVIFPGGLVLQTGAHKLFDHGLQDLVYVRTIAAPNGEDYLYLFNNLKTGTYLHLRYNLIEQKVDTPLICNGQAFFDDGLIVSFRSDEHAQKHHALQRWQTPFVGPNYQTNIETDSMLYKIGNRELVRGMAECQELLQLIDKDDSYAELYVDLSKRATDIIDSYFWLDRDETMRLAEPIVKIRDAANAAVSEFDKVIRVRRETESALADTQRETKDLIAAIGRSTFESITDFVQKLADVRRMRGHAIGLRELRYIELEQVEILELQLAEAADRLGHRCVQFLLSGKSLVPYEKRIADAESQIEEIESASSGRALQEQLEQISTDLELLIETISQLKIEDLTQRTAITDETGNLLAELNRVRSTLKSRIRDLLSGEMEADFASQTKLLDQAAAGALETVATPEKVDEALTRMMLQLEELEGRFAEFDELLTRLTEKRESLYEAFESRRRQLVEARSRRAEGLVTAANRIMQGITSRAARQESDDAMRSYFVSDPMVDKVRQIATQLQELGDSVRMEDVLSRLKTIADDAVRQLRDRKDLFTGGEGQIQLGKHHFSVNTQPVELTSVVRDRQIQLHLTGTQFYQPMVDAALSDAEDLWQQALPSESDSIARIEFLAALLLDEVRADRLRFPTEESEQTEVVRGFMQSRHDEGYSRGVHDRDAARIVRQLIRIDSQLGLLRFPPSLRATTWYVWNRLVPDADRSRVNTWIDAFDEIVDVLPKTTASEHYRNEIQGLLAKHQQSLISQGLNDHLLVTAADYLFAQLRLSSTQMLVSPIAIETLREMNDHLTRGDQKRLEAAIEHNRTLPSAAWTLALDAVSGYLRHAQPDASQSLDPLTNYRHEIAWLLLADTDHYQPGSDVDVATEVSGLISDHPSIEQSRLRLHYHDFVQRLDVYRAEVVPRFYRLRETKHRLIELAQKSLRTNEFKPRVLTSFVRNQLLDEVYLPLIGDNLAKQMGASGDSKRTDRMGLLLLISPPGYGKTTLMEYVANRLGLVFVKVNGPALGHNVTSLDPNEATNASAREEVNRINLALEMGDNVMLYLDDIQHCNPELLQKFIPLCDATRRIEGVWRSEPKTYDLRGRKVAVVMAGNPYTESGDRFQIPDMLSNRADVYNLGEIIGDSKTAFEMSYIENCLTSNNVLQPLARASNSDQRAMIQSAGRGSLEDLELDSNLAADDASEMISVLEKLLVVRDVVLKINREYIRSAAQADAYRTEPPFKLQGSYRNMNRIAEKVVPVMNDQELHGLIVSAYEQDAQTLTRDSESNLLKFKELLGILTTGETQRWENIRYAYVESVRMQGVEGDDSTAQVLRSLVGLKDGLESIRRTIASVLDRTDSPSQQDMLQSGVTALSTALEGLGNQFNASIATGIERIEKTRELTPSPKVLVNHSVPRVITDLIESQYQLLYDGLRPILETNQSNSKQFERLQNAIEKCLSDYQNLRNEIENQ